MTEYRVRWRREGRQVSTRIYQRGESAHRKARGILALEDVKHDTSMETLPALVEPPVIEEREVGAWSRADVQPSPPGEHERDRIRMLFAKPTPRDAARGGFLEPF